MDREVLRSKVWAWWESQAPADRGGEGDYEVPEELKWWKVRRGGRPGGRGRDLRTGRDAWERCNRWDPLLGSMGYAPPGYKALLTGVGVEAASAAAAVKEMERIMREGSKELWGTRCEGQREEEAARDITDEEKRDKEKAKEWRRSRRGGFRRRTGRR